MDACHTGLGGVCGGGLGILQCGECFHVLFFAVLFLRNTAHHRRLFFAILNEQMLQYLLSVCSMRILTTFFFLMCCFLCFFAKQVGTEKYAHRERTAAELYGSVVGTGKEFVGGGEYTLEDYIVPVGDGRRDFFSID